MKGCGKGSKEEKIADQVGSDECFRSAMTSEFCGTAARRSRTGGYSSGAVGG